MKLVTYLTSKERIYYNLSEQLEHLNLGVLLIESESSSAPCPNKISAPFFLSLFDSVWSLSTCLVSSPVLLQHPVVYPPDSHFQLKVDTYWIHTEVQWSCHLYLYLLIFTSSVRFLWRNASNSDINIHNLCQVSLFSASLLFPHICIQSLPSCSDNIELETN